MSKAKKTCDAVELMDKWYGQIPGWDEMVAEEELKIQIGQALYDLRYSVGMSQAGLARLAGSSQAIISRVENADYDGNAIEILKRVCFALHTKISIQCTQLPSSQPTCELALTP
jgi:DNA-binding XRE family transcriptional regulator